MQYNKHFNVRQTTQSQPIPGTSQIANSAGGFAWQIDNWAQLERFLILGSEGGTFYASERPLTIDNANAVLACLEENGERVVAQVVEISQSGRAPKNDPALFVLAVAAGLGDDATRRAALQALPQVARIGTHLFNFMGYVEGFRGWGRGLRRAVGRWYTDMDAGKLAYQTIKYQKRNGWSHRDALRLAHPVAPTETHDRIFNWVTQGWETMRETPVTEAKADQLLWAFEQAKRAGTAQQIVDLITTHKLPWEAIPTEWLAERDVWAALLPNMGLTALIRNLGRLSAIKLLTHGSVQAKLVVERLSDAQALKRARIHPIAVLSALKTYERGQGLRGSLKWHPVARVVNALDRAFYATFEHVEPTGKRIILSLDVSGSMGWGEIAGVPGLTPRVGSTAMALVTAATETEHTITAFSHEMVPVSISPRQRLDDALRITQKIPMGGTDCALPMLWALENKVQADAFVIYTDSETWSGKIHPAQALDRYRQETGIPAKLIVVGMVANHFTIARPEDGGMLDVVGFNTAVPNLMADFMRK